MTELRWPDGRGVFIDRDPDVTPDGDRRLEVPPGDTVTVEDDDREEQYISRGFEAVEGDDSTNTDDSDDTDDSFDADSLVDRTPVADVVDDIDAGKADDHLDAVVEAEDRLRDGRVTVMNAVEKRRQSADTED